MANLHVNAMKANLGALSRAYMFNVYFTAAPVDVVGGENIATYLVRSTSLPENVIESLTVPWQGQEYKIGSTHTFSEWEVTFNLDSAAQLRKEMLAWMKKIHDPATNVQGNPSEYFGEIRAELLDVKGGTVMTYILHQAWPSNVATVDLAQDSKEVSQFSVTFTYNWHTEE